MTTERLIAALRACACFDPNLPGRPRIRPLEAPQGWQRVLENELDQRGLDGGVRLSKFDWTGLLQEVSLAATPVAQLGALKELLTAGAAADILSDAPYLEFWAPALDDKEGPILVGLMKEGSGEAGRWILSQTLIAIRPSQNWACTFDGCYRLGQQVDWAEVQGVLGPQRDRLCEFSELALKDLVRTLRHWWSKKLKVGRRKVVQ